MSAVSYQSHQTGSTTSGSSVAPSKPTSLAVGDGMVAFIAQLGAGGTITAPAGWTQAGTTQYVNTSLAAALFYKQADSSDVAASSFTFSSGGTGRMVGDIARFTGDLPSSLIDQVISNTGASGTSVTTTGITPTRAMGTFLMFIASHTTAAADNTASTYSVTTANPGTWTEAYDLFSTSTGQSFSSEYFGLTMAYGSRNALSASGNSSATLQRSSEFVVFLANIAPAVTPPFAVTATIPSPSIPQLVSPFHLNATMPVPTSAQVAPDWSTTTKHPATVTNLAKS